MRPQTPFAVCGGHAFEEYSSNGMSFSLLNLLGTDENIPSLRLHATDVLHVVRDQVKRFRSTTKPIEMNVHVAKEWDREYVFVGADLIFHYRSMPTCC